MIIPPKTVARLSRVALPVVAIAIVGVLLWVCGVVRRPSIKLSSDHRIGPTAEKIEELKAIGQWEFLTISDEQLVDTVRRGLLSDDHLARIYYGTMRLGIDLSEVRPGWIVAHGDSVGVTLPPIKLLDERFIDEARTRPFAESGRWTAADREALYERAHCAMLRHGLSQANIRSAENNADAQFRAMLRAMGFENITIRFERVQAR